MREELFDLLAARRGHFRLESGHHGDLWLDLELLCLRPGRVQPLAVVLAKQLATHGVEVVCGPLVEGAFIALMVASELGVEFCYAERSVPPLSDALYPVEYRIPDALRSRVHGKRVAIVNDVTNAGSAVRGACTDLQACGAEPATIGTLLVLGSWALSFAAEKKIPLESIAALPNSLWTPSACPLCASRVPLEDPGR